MAIRHSLRAVLAIASGVGLAFLGVVLRADTSELPQRQASTTADVSASVWVANHRVLQGVDAATVQEVLTVPLPHEPVALAVDPADGSIWVLAHNSLLKFDRTTSLIIERDLRALDRRLEDPKHLALNPYDGSVWIAGEKTLLHVDRVGAKLGAWRMDDDIRSLAIGLSEHVWILSKRQLLRINSSGTVTQERDLPSVIKGPEQIAVDDLGRRLWLATDKALYRLDAADPSSPPVPFALPDARAHRQDKDDGSREIRALALAPVTGELWVVTRRDATRLARDGSTLANVDLKANAIGKIKAAAVEPLAPNLWLADHKTLFKIASGGTLQAKLGLHGDVEALGVVPGYVQPHLALLEPAQGALTGDARPAIRVQLGAACNAAPCALGHDYLDSIVLGLALNGQTIPDAFVPSAGVASYRPEERLPEGLNTFTVTAVDALGHRPEPITAQFTVDTIPPRFVRVAPPDPATASTPEIEIAGAVDDAAATVTIENLLGLGGTTLSANPLDFRFRLPLKIGANAFTLVAQDPAGSVAKSVLRITRTSGAMVAIAHPLPNATISGDRTLVSGTFEGPANTGIVVNGVVATTFGNRFFANNVPLRPGENTLNVAVSTIDDDTVSQAFTVASTGRNRVWVEQVSPASAVMRTVAGSGVDGFSGDDGPAVAAALSWPWALARARDGTIYVVDSGNNRIRRITPNGAITAFAGTGEYGTAGDGGRPARRSFVTRIGSRPGPTTACTFWTTIACAVSAATA